MNVEWSRTADAVEQWRGRHGQDDWAVRVNDFPDEPLYTLLINGKEVETFDNWPAAWTKLSQGSPFKIVRKVVFKKKRTPEIKHG